MKFRPDLTPESPEVLSSPNDFYIDPKGNVCEIEDLYEPLLFGTVDIERTETRLEDRKKRRAKRIARTINKRSRGKR